MLGNHTVHHFSSTQANVALSSAEAELNASVKCTSELIGLRNLMMGFNVELEMELNIDSSAAKCICHRRGAGEIKHVAVNNLWIQEWVMKQELTVSKVPRDDNPSDCLTHYWSLKDAVTHFANLAVGV